MGIPWSWRRGEDKLRSPPVPPDLPIICAIILLFACLKILFISSYHSTDFEVHRNWLAVTHTLPLASWYVDTTSPWTLDYPPLFAWFEWFLSQLGALVDPSMVDLHRLNYASPRTIVFQRLSVLLTELLFLGSVVVYFSMWPLAANRWQPNHHAKAYTLPLRWTSQAFVVLGTVGSAGLILVDHLHFQYNGMLLGLLMWSLMSIVQADRHVLGAILFAILLNLKHLFVYAAPVIFLHLLHAYCMQGKPRWSLVSSLRFIRLGLCSFIVFAVSLGPVLIQGSGSALLRRLFPFQRGLCHAYWAPNLWALYATLDKVLSLALGIGKVASRTNDTSSSTQHRTVIPGQHFAHAGCPMAVLPTITPQFTLALTLVGMAPMLVVMWKRQTPRRALTKGVAYAMLCGFMFGYHVHEKAALSASVPLIFSLARSFSATPVSKNKDGKIPQGEEEKEEEEEDHEEISPDAWEPLTLGIIVMNFAQSPLIFTLREFPAKSIILVGHAWLLWTLMRRALVLRQAAAAAAAAKEEEEEEVKVTEGTSCSSDKHLVRRRRGGLVLLLLRVLTRILRLCVLGMLPLGLVRAGLLNWGGEFRSRSQNYSTSWLSEVGKSYPFLELMVWSLQGAIGVSTMWVVLLLECLS